LGGWGKHFRLVAREIVSRRRSRGPAEKARGRSRRSRDTDWAHVGLGPHRDPRARRPSASSQARRSQSGDPVEDAPEQLLRHRHLRHLEDDVTPVRHLWVRALVRLLKFSPIDRRSPGTGQIAIRSISSSVIWSVVRSYSFVVRGDSCAAICCACSRVPPFWLSVNSGQWPVHSDQCIGDADR